MIRIHNFARGARGLRLMWQCEEMGLPYEVRVIPYPQPADYLALHPLGNVPFLEDEGGVAIHESIAIMLYLAGRYGPTPLLPAGDPALYARVLQMTVFTEATFGAVLNTLMIAHFGAPEAEKRNWSIGVEEKRAEQALGFIADKLGERPYLAGDALTLADIAVCTSLGVWAGALNKPIPEKLIAYRERLMAREAYARAKAASAPAS